MRSRNQILEEVLEDYINSLDMNNIPTPREIEAEVILLAKNVDGVYTADPNIDSSAVKFDSIKYIDVLNKGLKVMDSTAISLCMDNNIPIEVFGLNEPENIIKVIKGEKIGTYVGN